MIMGILRFEKDHPHSDSGIEVPSIFHFLMCYSLWWKWQSCDGVSLYWSHTNPLGENLLWKWSIISLHTNSSTIFWQVLRRLEHKASSLLVRDRRSVQVIHPLDLLFNPFHFDGHSFQFNQWPIHSIVVPSLLLLNLLLFFFSLQLFFSSHFFSILNACHSVISILFSFISCSPIITPC